MPEGPATAARDGVGIASVMARRHVDARAIGDRLGSDMPEGPRAQFAGARVIVGTGPGTWLVITEAGEADAAEELRETLAGIASVSDQSSGYRVRRLSGETARIVLQRGAAIDLHPDVFRPGSAATTVIAHIGVIFWQVDERPTYDVAIFRSYADSFDRWLDHVLSAL